MDETPERSFFVLFCSPLSPRGRVESERARESESESESQTGKTKRDSVYICEPAPTHTHTHTQRETKAISLLRSSRAHANIIDVHPASTVLSVSEPVLGRIRVSVCELVQDGSFYSIVDFSLTQTTPPHTF